MSDRILRTLITTASKAVQIGPSRHSTVIADRGRILAVGWNQMKTHPIMMEGQGREVKKPFLHAEAHALVNLLREYPNLPRSGLEVYNFRLSKGGYMGNSKPCSVCHSLLTRYGFRSVHCYEESQFIIEGLNARLV